VAFRPGHVVGVPLPPGEPFLRYRFVMFAHRHMWVSALVLPVAVVFAAVAGANPGGEITAPAGGDAHACCPEVAVAAPAPELLPDAAPEAVVVPAAHVDPGPRSLPPGITPEQGLQVKTILAARSVSAAFPQIRNAIGVRPDARPWHPNGLAIDLMIPNPGSSEGIALGDSILSFVMDNAGRFGVQDVIWRGTYYTPGGGAGGSGYGHYDHVHITTIGGGFPTGGEEYPAG
jgi:hypothetical protein